jgi:hypothetical protein
MILRKKKQAYTVCLRILPFFFCKKSRGLFVLKNMFLSKKKKNYLPKIIFKIKKKKNHYNV